MRSRSYNKRFELYGNTGNYTSDGFGGNIPVFELLAKSWCKISTFNVGSKNNNSLEYGLIDPNNALIITTRKRNDITYNSEGQYIIYRGEKYIISTDPVNVNFEDNEIKFIVTKASSVQTNNIE